MNPSSDGAGRPARILVVDDQRENREVLAVVLESNGFLVLTATSGEEAIASVAEQPPDLILLDVMMPGMDGYQLACKLKSSPATKNIPILMVTALDGQNARTLALSAGAADLLTKPFGGAELCVSVRNLLRLKTPQG
jgi:putative two-component system response regulator